MLPQRRAVNIYVDRLKLQRRDDMAPIKGEVLSNIGHILPACPSVLDHPCRNPTNVGCAEGNGWVDSDGLVFSGNFPKAHDIAREVILEFCQQGLKNPVPGKLSPSPWIDEHVSGGRRVDLLHAHQQFFAVCLESKLCEGKLPRPFGLQGIAASRRSFLT